MNNILNIIRALNGGNILPGQNDSETHINLETSFDDLCDLYKDNYSGNYYFFANYKYEDGKSNLGDIEKSTIQNTCFSKTPKPSDSYLILFWQVNEINDSVLSKVISLEENEFFFKKYVLYYTQDELDDFLKWIDSSDTLVQLINKLDELKDYNFNYAQFAIKLITKVPFFKLEFPKKDLEEFETILQNNINSKKTNKQDIIDLMELIDDMIITTTDPEKIAKRICELKLGDD